MSWITVPRLPDYFYRKAAKSTPVRAVESTPVQSVPATHMPTYKIAPCATGPRAEGPAGYLKRLAEQPPEAHQGPQSFDELARLIYKN